MILLVSNFILLCVLVFTQLYQQLEYNLTNIRQTPYITYSLIHTVDDDEFYI